MRVLLIELIGICLLRLEKNRWQQQDSENVKIDSLFRQEYESLALSSFVFKVDRKLIKKEMVLISFLKQFLGVPRIFFFEIYT